MSFWRRLFGGDGSRDVRPEEESTAPELPGARETPRSEPFKGFLALGGPGASEDEALASLAAKRGTLDEGALLDHLARGLARAEGFERLRFASAKRLVERGDTVTAAALLDGATSPEARLLAADLAAERGQLGVALGLVERVLARELDRPGAKERRERWRAALGLVEPRRAADAGVTIVAPEPGPSAYRLVREVARGGAGAVYEAEEVALGRRVAFKAFHARGREASAIRDEARRTAALAGPYVVRVLDADPDAGWIAYEWCANGSLRDALSQPERAAAWRPERLARSLAAGLARLHERGLVHGDLKPANVLLRGDDVCLTDFGLTLPAGATPLGGTPGYLPPERLEGSCVAPSDDVYALGRIVEELVAASPVEDTVADALVRPLTGPRDTRPQDAAAVLALLARRS